jgi:hypothetical protein
VTLKILELERGTSANLKLIDVDSKGRGEHEVLKKEYSNSAGEKGDATTLLVTTRGKGKKNASVQYTGDTSSSTPGHARRRKAQACGIRERKKLTFSEKSKETGEPPTERPFLLEAITASRDGCVVDAVPFYQLARGMRARRKRTRFLKRKATTLEKDLRGRVVAQARAGKGDGQEKKLPADEKHD